MPTTKHPPGLSQDQVDFFCENGYLVVRQAIDPDTITTLREATARLQDHYAEARREPGVHYTSPSATRFEEMMDGSAAERGGGDAVLWRVDDLEPKMPEIATLKSHPFPHLAMDALLGSKVVQYNESFVTKPPRIGQPVLWHQDPSFKKKSMPDPISTIDVYLDRADEDNGCLWVVPGSHKWGVVDAKAMMDEYGFDLPGAQPVRMDPGDVAFHDNGCLHGSKAIPSDRQRRILYLAFQTERQARSTGQFADDFINHRLKLWHRYREQALGTEARHSS